MAITMAARRIFLRGSGFAATTTSNSCFKRLMRPSTRIGMSPLVTIDTTFTTRAFSTDKTPENKNNKQQAGPRRATAPDAAVASNGSGSSGNNKAEASSSTVAMEEPDAFNTVYVHPLSQIVLRYFQTSCHDWIRSRRLDENLVIHRDGTFVLTQPPLTSNSSSSSSSSSLRIWTYYDGEDRKHWLSVTVNQVHHRFLLQDNLLSAWRGYKRNSLAERVQESVHDLIEAVKELD